MSTWPCVNTADVHVRLFDNMYLALVDNLYTRYTYTRRQINLYRMFFTDFSVNSQPILMNFERTIFESHGDYPDIFIKKYYVVKKLDHLTCNKFEITTSLYKPIKLV